MSDIVLCKMPFFELWTPFLYDFRRQSLFFDHFLEGDPRTPVSDGNNSAPLKSVFLNEVKHDRIVPMGVDP